eukprot:g609.t1
MSEEKPRRRSSKSSPAPARPRKGDLLMTLAAGAQDIQTFLASDNRQFAVHQDLQEVRMSIASVLRKEQAHEGTESFHAKKDLEKLAGLMVSALVFRYGSSLSASSAYDTYGRLRLLLRMMDGLSQFRSGVQVLTSAQGGVANLLHVFQLGLRALPSTPPRGADNTLPRAGELVTTIILPALRILVHLCATERKAQLTLLRRQGIKHLSELLKVLPSLRITGGECCKPGAKGAVSPPSTFPSPNTRQPQFPCVLIETYRLTFEVLRFVYLSLSRNWLTVAKADDKATEILEMTLQGAKLLSEFLFTRPPGGGTMLQYEEAAYNNGSSSGSNSYHEQEVVPRTPLAPGRAGTSHNATKMHELQGAYMQLLFRLLYRNTLHERALKLGVVPVLFSFLCATPATPGAASLPSTVFLHALKALREIADNPGGFHAATTEGGFIALLPALKPYRNKSAVLKVASSLLWVFNKQQFGLDAGQYAIYAFERNGLHPLTLPCAMDNGRCVACGGVCEDTVKSELPSDFGADVTGPARDLLTGAASWTEPLVPLMLEGAPIPPPFVPPASVPPCSPVLSPSRKAAQANDKHVSGLKRKSSGEVAEEMSLEEIEGSPRRKRRTSSSSSLTPNFAATSLSARGGYSFEETFGMMTPIPEVGKADAGGMASFKAVTTLASTPSAPSDALLVRVWRQTLRNMLALFYATPA